MKVLFGNESRQKFICQLAIHKKTYKELVSRGVEFVRGPKPYDNLAIFDDPDGNRLYLTSQPDENGRVVPDVSRAEPTASSQISTIHARVEKFKDEG
jgi:hypothetical protein